MLELLFAKLAFSDLPEGCQEGAHWIEYIGEVFFDRATDDKLVETIDASFKWLYHALEVTGSFCPKQSGMYQFWIRGKSYITFELNGTQIPSSLGPGGSCLPGIKYEGYTERAYFYANRCYPLKIRLRSGCSLYQQHCNIYYSYDGDPWEPAHDYISCTYDNCLPGYYSYQCLQCPQCPEGQHCDEGLSGTGKCVNN